MENQRIRLSKAMLKDALLRLLKEKPLNQISILELCETAQINRTTFYKYYGSQEDLLTEIENDFFAQLNEDLKDVVEKQPNDLTVLLNHLFEERETFCILVKAIPSEEFTTQLFQVPAIAGIFQRMMDASGYTETEDRYIRRFVLQGTYAVLCDWLGSEDPEPVPEIARILGLLKSKF